LVVHKNSYPHSSSTLCTCYETRVFSSLRLAVLNKSEGPKSKETKRILKSIAIQQ
jgi:hypothetical protein